jgi:superfamily II DNA or RNA helicase|tara:strand:- start:114 stop:1394 length:1281 start_codon:yes stop_codon:yes gene_type:complete
MPGEAWRNTANEYRQHLRQAIGIFENSISKLLDDSSDLDEEAPAVPQTELLNKSGERPKLFRYQSELVSEVLTGLPGIKGLLALPTGAGKTRTALAVCMEGFSSGLLRRIVWLAPTVELIDQAYETARILWSNHGGLDELFLSRDLAQVESDSPTLIFATPQAIYQRMQKVAVRTSVAPDFVVFDEAHQLGAPTFRAAVEALGCLDESQPVGLIGLSATPGRTDDDETEHLVNLFAGQLLTAESLGREPIRTLEQMGVLAKVEFQDIPVRHPPGRDTKPRLEIAFRFCRWLIEERRAKPLVFAPDVASAVVLAEALSESGLKAHAVHSDLRPETRRRVIQEFADGHAALLTNHRILATGYDCPAVSDLVFLNQVGSAIQFEQMVGRACRGIRTGGAHSATVWEFDDHRRLHGLPKSYYRYRDFNWK